MVVFWTATLLISAFVILLLVGIKHYELTTGRVLGAGIRMHSSRFFHGISLWVERIIPTLVRMYSKIMWRNIRSFFHKSIARVVVAIERKLQILLDVLKRATETKSGASSASAFLKEVSEHKRKLLRTGTGHTQRKKIE